MATKQIWKYVLEVTDEQIVAMPEGAQILKHAECIADRQRHVITIWAVIPDRGVETVMRQRFLRIIGTGNALPEQLGEHVATVRDGTFIWHVFDVGEL